jgi:hypothetical protein
MTQPHSPATEPWLDRLRQDAIAHDAPPAGRPAADFTRGVLAAWDQDRSEGQDATRTPEPWLEHLAADAHAPKPEAFTRRAVEAFAAVQTRGHLRRRTWGRIAFAAGGLTAATLALVVGLRPWAPATPTDSRIAPTAHVSTPENPHGNEHGIASSVLASLQDSAQNWLDRQNLQMRRRVNTLTNAREKTNALLTDYAVPVHVSRILLAPVVPALIPTTTAPAPKQEAPPSPGSGPNGPVVRPDSWLS